MKESDYIAATNLAKLRIAQAVMRDFFPETKGQKKVVEDIASSLAVLVAHYELAVQEKPSKTNTADSSLSSARPHQ